MKLRCEVIAVSTNGETLSVTMQGRAMRAPKWHSLSKMEIVVPSTDTMARTYRVGRVVILSVEARP